MRGMPRATVRTFIAALAVSLAACSDITTSDPLLPEQSQPRLLTAGGSQLLTSSQTLTPGAGVNAVTYSVTMPASGPIYLTFNGRIDWPNTAGNSNVLKIEVNGVTVDSTRKSAPASYTYSGGWSERYYDWRGQAYGQPERLWGLFWSPDFVQNTVSSNSYYVTSATPYHYELNLTGLVRYSQANSITIRNLGGWVTALTGNTPNAVLQNVTLRNY